MYGPSDCKYGGKNREGPILSAHHVCKPPPKSGGWCTHLITGCAARFELLGIVSLTEKLLVVHAVREIHQQFTARRAHKAGGVPHDTVTKLGCHHPHFTGFHRPAALRAFLWTHTIINYYIKRNNRILNLSNMPFVHTG